MKRHVDVDAARRYLEVVAEDGALQGYHASGTPCHSEKRKCPIGGCVGHNGEHEFGESILRLIRKRIPSPPKVLRSILNESSSIEDVLGLGISMCSLMRGSRKNDTGAVFVKNKDVGEFLVGKKGLKHGLRPYRAKTVGDIAKTQKYNAYVMTVLGDVLKNAFMLRVDKKEKTGREYDSVVLMSACVDGDDLIPVLIRLNKTEGTITKIVVLKSINTKKQDRADVFDSGFGAPDDPACSHHAVDTTDDDEILSRLALLCQ